MHLFLNNPHFRKLSLASILSVFGDRMYYLALITFVSTFQHANLAIGLITISELLPALLSSFTGYKADSTIHRGKMILLSGVARFVIYIVIGFSFMLELSQWSILLLAVGLNFISDTLGSYATGLMTPLVVEVTGEKDYPVASGFTSGMAQIVGLISQFIGVSLLTVASFGQLAHINAGAFLLTSGIMLLFFRSNPLLAKKQVQYSGQVGQDEGNDNNSADHSGKVGYIASLKQSFRYLKQEKQLLPVLISILLLNSALSSITPILQMMIAANQALVVFSYSMTVALIGAMITISMSVGGLFGVPLLKNYRLQSITFYCLLALSCFFLTLLLQNIYIICFFLLPIGFLVGVCIPKLSAWIVGAVAKENLAISVGIINTVLAGIAPISTLIFVTIASTTSPMLSVWILFINTLMIAIYQLISKMKERKKNIMVEVG